MELGELISYYRKQEGLTIDDLSAKSGVPKGTLNKIINGITKAPTLDNIKAIAKALNKTLDDFDDVKENALSDDPLEGVSFALKLNGDELTEAELDDVRKYIRFIKSQREEGNNADK